MAFSGLRIRLRRVSDGATLYDSVDVTSFGAHMLVDTAGATTETYSVDLLQVQDGTTNGTAKALGQAICVMAFNR